MKKPMFAVVDCDNFFASCEKVFRPDLTSKPVVVLSSNDGCVVARSREAKALGIPMGAPAFKWQSFFQEHDVKKLSGNFSLYGDFSERVVKILSSYTPEIEVYSIDESFVRLDGVTKDYEQYAHKIRDRILQWTGISVSIGIAPTKTLAKAAVEYAKKHDETNHVLSVDPGLTPSIHEAILEFLPVQDIWGIGRRLGPKLNSFGVYSAKDYCNLPEGWVRSELHINGMRILRELKGESFFRLEPERFEWRKNIAATRSFGNDVTELHELEQAIASHIVRAAHKLRKQKGVTQRITLFADSGRQRSGSFYKGVRDVKLKVATNYTPDLLRAAINELPHIYQRGIRFYRAGVIFHDIRTQKQLNLFAERDQSEDEQSELMSTVDELNKRWGNKTVTFGSEPRETKWRPKSDYRSPPYTMSWKSLPVVKTS